MTSKTKTRALTVHQPYATSLVSGVKPVEIRKVARLGGPSDPTAVPRGAFVGAITLGDVNKAEDCRRKVDDLPDADGILLYGYCSPWAHSDGWHWTVDRYVEFDDPLPAKGKQGLWIPSAAAIALLARTIGVDR